MAERSEAKLRVKNENLKYFEGKLCFALLAWLSFAFQQNLWLTFIAWNENYWFIAAHNAYKGTFTKIKIILKMIEQWFLLFANCMKTSTTR